MGVGDGTTVNTMVDVAAGCSGFNVSDETGTDTGVWELLSPQEVVNNPKNPMINKKKQMDTESEKNRRVSICNL